MFTRTYRIKYYDCFKGRNVTKILYGSNLCLGMYNDLLGKTNVKDLSCEIYDRQLKRFVYDRK